MRWELRFDEQGYQVEAKHARGIPLPAWYLDEPPQLPFADELLQHFWILDTERSPAGSGLPGRIPESKVRSRAFRLGWPDDMIELFIKVMLRVDREYITWIHKEREKRNPQ